MFHGFAMGLSRVMDGRWQVRVVARCDEESDIGLYTVWKS